MSMHVAGLRMIVLFLVVGLVASVLVSTSPVSADFTTPGTTHSTDDHPQLPVGGGPTAVTAADFNGDGQDDFAATTADEVDKTGNKEAWSWPYGMAVVMSDGSGGYKPATFYPLGMQERSHQAPLPCCPLAQAGERGPHDVIASDVNGDTRPDLVAVNTHTDSVSVLLNSYEHTGVAGMAFVAPASYPPDSPDVWLNFPNWLTDNLPDVPKPLALDGISPRGIATADVDGDGHADLVTANSGSNDLSVLLNIEGTGSYKEQTTHSINGSAPYGVAAADLDGDGDKDLVTANRGSNDVSVLLNESSGNLKNHGTHNVGSRPVAVAVEKLDSDNDPDVVVANSGDDTVSVLLNDGSGGLSAEMDSPYDVGDTPVDVALGDLNGDGNTDVATVNSSDDEVWVLRHDGILDDGDSSFSPEPAGDHPYSVGRFPLSIAIGNFDPDGASDVDPDLVAGNKDGESVTVLNNE